MYANFGALHSWLKLEKMLQYHKWFHHLRLFFNFFQTPHFPKLLLHFFFQFSANCSTRVCAFMRFAQHSCTNFGSRLNFCVSEFTLGILNLFPLLLWHFDIGWFDWTATFTMNVTPYKLSCVMNRKVDRVKEIQKKRSGMP